MKQQTKERLIDLTHKLWATVFWLVVLIWVTADAAEFAPPLPMPREMTTQEWEQTSDGQLFLKEWDEVHYCDLPTVTQPECDTRWYLVVTWHHSTRGDLKYILPPSLASKKRCHILGGFVIKQMTEADLGIECIPTATPEE